MSKMPAKKKSCFQITSVTQAQVAASSITDDTESLDDPDESRTEDVSSEIFDVSRADAGACERSSSEETLNNVGETQQEGRPPSTGPVNGGVSYKSLGTGRVSVPALGPAQPSQPSAVTSPGSAVPVTGVAPTAPVSTSCSSRFRVIKLDHGTGEPFRRGRWMCTEFYDRDSDLNANRTVDGIKPTVAPDHGADRDSGLGATVGSVLTSSTFSAQVVVENAFDGGYPVGHPAHAHGHPSEPLQPGYGGSAPRIGSGSSAFQPTGYTTTASQQAQVNVHPVAPQNFLSNSLNGAHHGGLHQKSPIMPPAYSTHPAGPSAGQTDYRQQHFGSSTQILSMGPPSSQAPSPVLTGAASGAQGPVGEAGSRQGLLLHVGNAAIQTQPSGGTGGAATPPVTSHSGVHNSPATVPSTTNTPSGGGQVQAQGARGGGGATAGQTCDLSNQAEDGRPKSDVQAQLGGGVVPGKDGIKPFIREGLSLPTPVNSLFGIHITMNVDEDSTSGASLVAIDNKIEQAMDLVKSHLMYAVREEVEVLKEHIKELYERNSVLERENAVLKSLANSEQLGQLSNQLARSGSTSPPPPQQQQQQQQQQHALVTNNNNNNTTTPPQTHQEGSQSLHQPNITSA